MSAHAASPSIPLGMTSGNGDNSLLPPASANAGIVDPSHGMTAVQRAVSQPMEEATVVALLYHPTDNAVDEFGDMDTAPLHMACKGREVGHRQGSAP